jgi:hypothetical protein
MHFNVGMELIIAEWEMAGYSRAYLDTLVGCSKEKQLGKFPH